MIDESAWLAICFALFIIIAYKPIKNSILSFLDNKIHIIVDYISNAQNAKNEAEQEVAKLKLELENIDAECTEMLIKAQTEIKRQLEDRCKEFDKSLNYKLQAAEESMKQMQTEVLDYVEQGLIKLITHKIATILEQKGSTSLDIKILQNLAFGKIITQDRSVE